jgi:pyruvate dehydrogenase E2 component (dihydrolipoamide acetyltransferase)
LASKDIHLPDLGGFKDVAVIDVLVKPGDAVQVDTPLLTLETDKATMDVPSPFAGVIEALHVTRGARISTGSLIATLSVPEGQADALAPAAAAGSSAAGAAAVPATAVPAAAAPAAATAAPAPVPATAATAPAAAAPRAAATTAAAAPSAPVLPLASAAVLEAGFSRAHASPSVRKFARELGADLLRISGSGSKGRITEADVKTYVKTRLTADAGAGAAGGQGIQWPAVAVPDFAQYGPIEVKPLTRVQRIAGPRLHASWVNLPHVTQFDEADITELEEVRKTLKSKRKTDNQNAGQKITPLAFVVRACARALQQFPLFNSSLDQSGENLVFKQYIHIGFAADTPQGLLVPVIRDADRKDIYEIARALAELSQKARAGKLAGSEMQGGSFTISSLGGIGGTAFTPIINAPEVAILGVSRSVLKPVWRENGFVPRLMLPLSLSYDHRVIDGANGARFTTYLAGALADVHKLLEAVP